MDKMRALVSPLQNLTLNISNSGLSSPRMSLSRQSSLSAISLYERLEIIRRDELSLEEAQSCYIKKNQLPKDIIRMILSFVSKNCNRSGIMTDLVTCSMVDKRY